MTKYYLDPDYRNPYNVLVHTPYCAHCNRPIKNVDKAVKVSVDWNTMEVWQDENGTELLGSACWKHIRKTEPTTK